MRYGLLGSITVHDGERWQEIAATKPRVLLAALLLRCGDVVTVDQLLFELWGDRPPRTALSQIHGYVLRIRRALGADGAAMLTRVTPGYRLATGPYDLDSQVFLARSNEGQAALRAGDPEYAAELLGSALALWRAPALFDVPPSPLVTGSRKRFAELRLGAFEAKAEADLALGRHEELVDELTRHVTAHPLRETGWHHLMRALDRAGRRDDALAAYQRVHTILDEHSGIEPGPRLRALHDELRRPVPYQVRKVPRLVGRADELRVLDALAARTRGPVVATVAGPPGIGKTAFVRHWASGATNRFPDGQLYADLRGYSSGPASEPSAVLADFLAALGVPASEVPADEDARAAHYRSALSGRRVLVVLDNARDADQVRPLLPGPSACLVLVTSRDDLRGLTATHGAHLLRLPVLEPAAAVALLGRAGVNGDDEVAELATLCGHLPLALRIAAGRLAARTPVSDLLTALRAGDLAGLAYHRTGVRAAFDESYAALPEAARRTFRQLGLVPGTDFAVPAVAELAALPVPAAAAVLDRLAATHMVEPAGPGRFRLPDLLRRYARELAPVDSPAKARLAEHYLTMVVAAARLVSPSMALAPGHVPTAQPFADRAAALTWLAGERDNVVAAVGLTRGGWRLVDALRGYFSWWHHTGWPAAVAAGLAAATAEQSAAGRAAMHISRGLLAWHDGRLAESARDYRTACTLARVAGWPEGEATALNGIGRAAIHLERPAAALRPLTLALAIDRAVGFRAGEARELFNLGLALAGVGRSAEAEEYHQQAHELYTALDDDQGRHVVAALLAPGRRRSYAS